MKKKKEKNLGQYYTTNSEKIIGNLINFLPSDVEVIDPFAGNWDLLNSLPDGIIRSGYDIDPKNKETVKQDTLSNPLDYSGKFIITNPPYLAKNKNNKISNKGTSNVAINRKLYEAYQTDDLYKVSLLTLINGNCEGGILILPLNFFCDENTKIRNSFLSRYKIVKLNIFEEQVFDDTSYTVCSFFFIKSDKEIIEQIVDVLFFPTKVKTQFILKKIFGYRLAGDFFSILDKKQKYKISRIIEGDDVESGIRLRALDTGTMDGRIKLEKCEKTYVDRTENKTERTFCSFKFDVKLLKSEEEVLIKLFNEFIEKNREKYNSLFLTNFRNSTKSYARKRISFDLAYKLISYIIENNIEQFPSFHIKD